MIFAACSGENPFGIGNGMNDTVSVEDIGIPSGTSPLLASGDVFVSFSANAFLNAVNSCAPGAALATHSVASSFRGRPQHFVNPRQ